VFAARGEGTVKEYQYITIEEYGRSASSKTGRYEVRNKHYGDLLCLIAWYGAWRQYVCTPQANTSYSAGCLRDIASFIDSLKAKDSSHD
jgi:hypothetical protein